MTIGGETKEYENQSVYLARPQSGLNIWHRKKPVLSGFYYHVIAIKGGIVSIIQYNEFHPGYDAS